MWQIWLIIAGVFFILEMITTGFLVFWLGIGALLATIVSLFTDNIIIETAVFVISSGLLLFYTKPFVDKYVNKKKGKDVVTNAFSIIGQEAIVIESINSTLSTGQIKLDGDIWSAKSKEEIQEGTKVKILSIDGVKAIVEPISVEDVVLK